MIQSARVVCMKDMVSERGAISQEYFVYSKKAERSYGAIFSQNIDDGLIQRFLQKTASSVVRKYQEVSPNDCYNHVESGD